MIIERSSKNTIIKLIESLNPQQFKGLTTKIKYLYPSIYSKMKNFQNKNNIKTLSEVIYLVINDMDHVPVCPHLSNKCINKLNFKSILEGYHNYCKRCSSLNPDFIEKRQDTCLDKYGSKYPMQNKQILNKTIQTLIKKYGVDNAKKIKKSQ